MVTSRLAMYYAKFRDLLPKRHGSYKQVLKNTSKMWRECLRRGVFLCQSSTIAPPRQEFEVEILPKKWGPKADLIPIGTKWKSSAELILQQHLCYSDLVGVISYRWFPRQVIPRFGVPLGGEAHCQGHPPESLGSSCTAHGCHQTAPGEFFSSWHGFFSSGQRLHWRIIWNASLKETQSDTH